MPSDPQGLCVSPERLLEHLDVLQAEREIVALADVAAGTAAPNAVAITFDDGYGDIATSAAPALVEKQAPATLFVVTGHSAHNLGFWWDDLDRILRAAPFQVPATITLALGGQERIFRVATPQERRVASRHLHAWLQPMPPEAINEALTALRRWSGMPPGLKPGDGCQPMTIAEIQAFAATPALTVGSHSRTHRSLRHADPATQEAEIAGSRGDLAAWLGADPIGFSYPFGVAGANFDAAVAARVRDAGFRYAVANAPGVVTRDADRFALPRHAAPNVDGPRFAAWLAERERR